MMIRFHHVPRLMVAAVAAMCAATLAFATVGVTGMYRDKAAEAARLERAIDAIPSTSPRPAQDRELQALRDLVTYCTSQAGWGSPPCSTGGARDGSTLVVGERVPGDTTDITLKTGGSASTKSSPSPSPTRPNPNPTPTRKVTPPSDDGGQPTGRNGNGAGHGGGGTGRGHKGGR